MVKIKKIVSICTLTLATVMLTACQTENKEQKTNKSNDKQEKVTLILDYLPNTNHTGVYVAKEKGYYKDIGIDLSIIEPGQNNTSITLLGANKGDFALSYQEDLTYATASAEPIPVKAIAAVLEHNTSGFVTLTEDNIASPKQFENKTYSGWQSASEEAVLKAAMTNDGGDFSKLTLVGDSGAGAADLGKNVDIKWFFEGWDYTKAKMDGYDISFMPLNKLDKRLDFYTPIILAQDKTIESNPELVQKFTNATKKGYQYAIENPKESADILYKATPDQDLAFLQKSQEFLSKNYTSNPDKWGIMQESVWNNYTDFMFENKLIDKKIPAKDMYTNEFIEKAE